MESGGIKIAIVGSSGYIASALYKKMQSESDVASILNIDRISAIDTVYLELTNPQNFQYDLLDSIDYVIFTAAISGPDKCADDFDSCWDMNVTGTQYFIEQAIQKDCRVLFFSSDAVFGDISGMIYTENSVTQPITPYGKMKQAIENKFQNENKFKAIRLSYVVSSQDRFVSYCLQCIKENTTAEVFHPFYRNCVILSDVLDTVVWIVRNWDIYNHVFLNVAGQELVSRVRIADEINRILHYKLSYKIVFPNESFYKNRPSITQMQSDYCSQYEIIKQESFTVKIQRELGEI